MTKDDQEFLRLVTELAAMEQDGGFLPLTVDLGPYSGFVLVGALQLAWRHPGHNVKIRDLIEQIGRRIQDCFPPVYAELLEVGWDSSRDVEVIH